MYYVQTTLSRLANNWRSFCDRLWDGAVPNAHAGAQTTEGRHSEIPLSLSAFGNWLGIWTEAAKNATDFTDFLNPHQRGVFPSRSGMQANLTTS